jgi:hypothetical protein
MSLAPSSAVYAASDYGQVRERWTRSAQPLKLQALDTPLRVHATLFSPDFIAAYVAKSAAVYRLSASDRTELGRKLGGAAARSYSFFVGASTTDLRSNDLERKDSVWRIALLNDRGEQVSPAEIRAEKTIAPGATEFFPFLDSFYRAYHVRFPTTLADGQPLIREGTQKLVLLFAGPLGLAELTWRLR